MRDIAVERRLRAVGYLPLAALAFTQCGKAPVAQRIEHQTSNLGVAGSSPAGRTNCFPKPMAAVPISCGGSSVGAMMDALAMVRSGGGAAMTDEVYRHERQGLRAKLSDLTGGARDMVRAALKEAMNWDFYQWTVLALVTATFLLVALSYGGIRAELAALKPDRGVSDPARVDAEIGKQMADMKAGLTQSISDMKTGLAGDIAKISAKLEARSQQPKLAAPAAKPVVKPSPQ